MSWLAAEDIKWNEKHVLSHEAVTVFKDPEEELIRKGKVDHPLSLKERW